MPVLRMTKVSVMPQGNVLVDFDDGATLTFQSLEEMENAYNRFVDRDQSGFMRMMMIGDYLRRGDDTIGADYNPTNPTAVWVRRVN